MGRVAILADVHSNLAALEAVLRHAESLGPLDDVWFLGDAVGYGPQPNECVERLRGLSETAVMGNHDAASVGRIGAGSFSKAAAEAVEWTRGRLRYDCKFY